MLSHTFSCGMKVVVYKSSSTLQQMQGQLEVPVVPAFLLWISTNICHFKDAQKLEGDRAIRCVRLGIRMSLADQPAKASAYLERILFNILCSFICG